MALPAARFLVVPARASGARALIDKLPPDEQALRAEAKLQLDAAPADYRRAFELLDSEAGADLRYPLLVNQGVLRLERGEFEAAEADLIAASRLDASRLEPLLALAQVYLKQGKPDQAFDQLSRAIALRPDWAALYRGRADVQLARKNPTVAERVECPAATSSRRSSSNSRPARDLASDHAKRARLLVFRASRGRSPGGLRFRDQDRARALRMRIVCGSTFCSNEKRYDEVDRSCSASSRGARRQPPSTSFARWPVPSSKTSPAPSTT